MNTRLTAKLLVAAAPLVGLLSLACANRGVNPDPGATEELGSVGVALQLAPGNTVNVVSYQITGPQGFTRAGTLDVSQSSTLSAVVGGLPAGSGYSIALNAVSTNSTSCMGSAGFAVVARQTVAVSVHLTCHEG